MHDMVRMTTFILSLAILVTGFLGLTNLLPIFITYPFLANVGAILLGILGLLVTIYVGKSGQTLTQKKERSQQKEENIQLRKETVNQLKTEINQLKKETNQLKMENEQQRNMIEQQISQNSSKNDEYNHTDNT